jgi:hypothetical protein
MAALQWDSSRRKGKNRNRVCRGESPSTPPDSIESENPDDEVWRYQERSNPAPCLMNAEQYLPEVCVWHEANIRTKERQDRQGTLDLFAVAPKSPGAPVHRRSGKSERKCL